MKTVGNEVIIASSPVKPTLQILLATYNGEPFLPDLLESVLRQTYVNWELIIRDDGSTDRTREICEEYRGRDNRISTLDDQKGNLGANRNFEVLLGRASASYVMFCDQDDVWLPDKAERSVHALRELEIEKGERTPLLVYTDLALIGAHSEPISPSLYRFTGRDPRRNELRHMCVASAIYGCTMIVNRPLLSLLRPFPAELMYWDLWLAVIALSFGAVEYLDEVTVLYRRHSRNVSGLSCGGVRGIVRGLGRVTRYRHALHSRLRQFGLFQKVYCDLLPRSLSEWLVSVGSLPDQNWIMRRQLILRHRISKTGLPRNLAMFAFV